MNDTITFEHIKTLNNLSFENIYDIIINEIKKDSIIRNDARKKLSLLKTCLYLSNISIYATIYTLSDNILLILFALVLATVMHKCITLLNITIDNENKNRIRKMVTEIIIWCVANNDIDNINKLYMLPYDYIPLKRSKKLND